MKITFDYNGKNYAIKFDGTQYMPLELATIQDVKSPNYGKEVEREMGYFKNLSDAIYKVIKVDMGSSEETISLTDYVKRIEVAFDEIKEQVDTLSKVQ